MARLVTPRTGLHASLLAALNECQMEGRHLELDVGTLADSEEFARYVAAVEADVEQPGEPERYAERLTGAAPVTPEGGYVPQTTLWWVDGDEYLGRVGIRHYLSDHLRRHGGHLGYEVRPSARGRGHATAMLAAALPAAAKLGIDPAHLDPDASNVASCRVIEKNGGVLDRREGEHLFYLVPTGLNS